MPWPPPVRITAPLVALVFGLVATWFDYRLNLDLDLARHLQEIRERADSSGSRLARESEPLLVSGDRRALLTVVKAIPDVPQDEIVGVVDESGRIIADSNGSLGGQPVGDTALAPAAALINASGQSAVQDREDTQKVVSAHSFRIGEKGMGWALQVFDRAGGVNAARMNTRTQLGWMASAMALLSFALWTVLHFTFATRLACLANGVLDFGEGRAEAPPRLSGGDEVGKLSGAISTMAAKLRAREAEQVRLEREVLEISECERRRIGHDLHDSLGQQLTAASMTTNAFIGVLKTEAPALAERAKDIGQQLRDAIAEVRSLSHGLAPVALVDDGLMVALASLAEDTSRGGDVRCVFDCVAPVCVAKAELADHLYRIAQEAVNNALKHAAPSEIRIGLEYKDGALLIEVDDDGVGLDGVAAAADGIGLRVMRYRARLIGSDLHIGSPPAGGTRISCRVELPV
jgi:signal transduction histidine kinase